MTALSVPRGARGWHVALVGRWCWWKLRLLAVVVVRLAFGVRHSWQLLVAVDGLWLLWVWRHGLASTSSALTVVLAVYFGPLLAGVVWSLLYPYSFGKWISGPWWRWRWCHWARKNWNGVARECGLSVQRTRTEKVTRTVRRGGRTEVVREPREVSHWVAPRLSKVSTHGDMLSLKIRARVGQTLEDVEAAVPRLQVAASAESARSLVLSPCEVQVNLMMRNALTTCREAVLLTREEIVAVGTVPAGRTQDGGTWWLTVTNRHTLIAGCSGAGKGSVLWSVCGNLAPAVSTGEVQLWGIDLKRGIELSMGKAMFCCMVTSPAQAVEVLVKLLQVIDERGARMAGRVREHTPRPGDPLHVLVIDELAVLTAYSDPATVKEASRLLAEILTQGRALGVVVVACVQDPRKETIGMRSLFTQAVCLRQLSAVETRLVLGDGIAQAAPAHRIWVSQQGTGWVQDETGAYDKVRADYWPDPLIRKAASLHPAPVAVLVPTVQQTAEASMPPAAGPFAQDDDSASASAGGASAPRARKPRAPRKPRQPRSTVTDDGATGDVWGGDAA